MIDNKMKLATLLLVLSAGFVANRQKANAIIKKVVTSTVGAVSRATSSVSGTSSNSVRNTVRLNKLRNNETGELVSYSAYFAKKKDLNRQSELMGKAAKMLSENEKTGIFKTSTGNNVKLKIYIGHTEEGEKYEYIKADGGNEIPVTTHNGTNYIPTIQGDELLELIETHPGYVTKAIDQVGKPKYIVIIKDENNNVAYELSKGVFRDFVKDEENKVYLGHVVNLGDLENPLRKKAEEVLIRVSSYTSSIDLV